MGPGLVTLEPRLNALTFAVQMPLNENGSWEWRRSEDDRQMEDLHLRIATEDLPKIQQELNCAAIEAPSDPELMEALNSLSETEPIETLPVALDQMRHFLWFYSQGMGNEPEFGVLMQQKGDHCRG